MGIYFSLFPSCYIYLMQLLQWKHLEIELDFMTLEENLKRKVLKILNIFGKKDQMIQSSLIKWEA